MDSCKNNEEYIKLFRVYEKICLENKCKKERLKFEIKIDKIRGKVFVKKI